MSRNSKDQEAHELFRKIKEVIRDRQVLVIFGRIRQTKKPFDCGWHQAYVALVDVRSDMIDTLLHECLHHIQPSWCHRKIKPRVKYMMNTLGVIKLCELLDYALEHSFWLEQDFDPDEDIDYLDKLLKETEGAI